MKQIKNAAALLLAALIWGIAFVAQSEGMKYVGGFTFNCVRSLIGGIVLIPCIFLLKGSKNPSPEIPGGKANVSAYEKKSGNKRLLKGGVCCGIVLCIASNLQQQGMRYTTVGKAGFITALYIVLVPVLGIFLPKRAAGIRIWIGLILAVCGLYFLCINGAFTLGRGDVLVILCAIVFAVHIIVVDHYAPLVDCVALSCIQFFTCGILSAVPMFLLEDATWEKLAGAAIPILYAGVMSCGVAYTLQIIGQKNTDPTVAAMLLSTESVFSVLAGMVILHQMLSARELLGCCLVFGAVILSQLPAKEPKAF